MIIFVGEQFWCLNGSTLKNKANNCTINDALNLLDSIDGTISSKTNATQLWEKRNPNNKTCFIIAYPAAGKVLTAAFDGLKAKGNN